MLKNEQSDKQDIRIIQLAKWQIPKEHSVMEHMEDSYLAIGYYDMIDVQNVTQEKNVHPLLSAYNASHRHPEADSSVYVLENYTIQELFIFTNIDENEFGQERINDFWKPDSTIMFVSLIHIDNEIGENESVLDKIIKRIHDCFEGKDFLYYYSFDYSGIVLLAKKMRLKEYLNLMFKLNYNNTEGEKLIRDSYSFYGFRKTILNRYFEKFQATSKFDEVFGEDDVLLEEHFSISVNIGIQNYNLYCNFIDEVRAVFPDIKEYGLFGRHDVSIVKENADLKWLIYIQYLLNKYTISTEERPVEFLFSTHESFVKVAEMGKFTDTEQTEEEKEKKISYYKKAKKHLDQLCGTFLEKIEADSKSGDRYNGEYKIPIQAVKHSILSILKNRYAEDFVLCMYQSFCEFIEYLTEKMNDEDDDVMKFYACFSNYFRGLNSLVNSAMHSERQFIQATAFNAIIYDVPSKIMAFYVAVIDDLQCMMRSDKDKRYTFLLTPSFSNEISVEIISYPQERPPHDRILMVSINECSLYNPGAVIRRMAHEVAHFVGDELRDRVSRKKQIKLSIIYIILSHIVHGSFLDTDDIYDLIKKVEEEISQKIQFSDDCENYSERLFKIIPNIADEFYLNQEVKVVLKNYVKNFLKIYLGKPIEKIDINGKRKELRDYLFSVAAWNTGLVSEIEKESFYEKVFTETEIEVLTNLVFDDMEQETRYINRDREMLMAVGKISQSMIARKGSGILNDKAVGEYAKGIINTYSEAFSDVQMALLTNIGYKEYLEGFINEEKLNVKQLPEHMDDLARIAMVTFALGYTGVWDLTKGNELAQSEKLATLHELIGNQIDVLKNNISDDAKNRLKLYYGIADNCMNTDVDMNAIWKESVSLPESYDNTYFYIYENLFIYLVECIDKSLRHYKTPEKREKKEKFISIIETVTKFDDVQKVFFTICDELQRYKKKIFD